MSSTGTDVRGSGGDAPDALHESPALNRTEAIEALPMERVNPPRKFFRGTFSDLADILRYRELLGQLVRKELKVKYKDSVLGFFWTLVRPMTQLIIYYLAFTIFLGNQQPAYAVFIFYGLVVWGLFTDIVGGCTGSIVGNGGLLKKTYFPREIFPLSVVGAALVNFALQMLVLFGALAVTAVFTDNRVALTGDLGLVPLALLVCLVWGLGLGLFLAAATVYFRDLQHLIEIIPRHVVVRRVMALDHPSSPSRRRLDPRPMRVQSRCHPVLKGQPEGHPAGRAASAGHGRTSCRPPLVCAAARVRSLRWNIPAA